MFTPALAPTLRLWIASCHLRFGQPTEAATLVSTIRSQSHLTKTKKIDDGLGTGKETTGCPPRVWPCTDFGFKVGIDRKFDHSSSLSDVCDPYNLKYKPG
jgi:hypothetical protein